jgi:hypothetical protein
MTRRIRKPRPQNEVFRERAEKCRQLAEGAGDLAFAIKLHVLSREYESRANDAPRDSRMTPFTSA